jgi:hypothetical protein
LYHASGKSPYSNECPARLLYCYVQDGQHTGHTCVCTDCVCVPLRSTGKQKMLPCPVVDGCSYLQIAEVSKAGRSYELCNVRDAHACECLGPCSGAAVRFCAPCQRDGATEHACDIIEHRAPKGTRGFESLQSCANAWYNSHVLPRIIGTKASRVCDVTGGILGAKLRLRLLPCILGCILSSRAVCQPVCSTKIRVISRVALLTLACTPEAF